MERGKYGFKGFLDQKILKLEQAETLSQLEMEKKTFKIVISGQNWNRV